MPVYQHDFNPDLPDFEEVVEHISNETWGKSVPRDPYDAELQRVVQQVWIDELIGVAANERTAPAVRAMATMKLREIHGWLQENLGGRRDEETLAHRTFVYDQIDRYLLRDYRPGEGRVELVTPPGSPIGQDAPGYVYRRHQRQTVLDQWDRRYEACGVDGS